MLRLSNRLLSVVLNSRSSVNCITTFNFREHEVNNVGTKLNEDGSDEVVKEEILDDFTKEFFSNQIKVSDFQKVLLSAGSSIAALLDPRRQDMIACLGETTGEKALEKILDQMKQSEEGRSILKEKPRINTNTVNLAELKQLPEDTFGYHYYKFLEDNQVTPDSRLEVRFMENPELGYVMTRYRETHDLVHTILGMPTNMLGEVAVKWVEAINTGLPMCYGGAVFGAVRLKTKQRQMYKKYYLPWAITTGKELKPLLPVYWENRWTQNIDDLRKELNICTLELPVDN